MPLHTLWSGMFVCVCDIRYAREAGRYKKHSRVAVFFLLDTIAEADISHLVFTDKPARAAKRTVRLLRLALIAPTQSIMTCFHPFTPSVRGGFPWKKSKMKISIFVDPALNDDAAVRALVQTQQATFQKARGSDALALMVASAYVAIRKIITNASAETQAAILDEHGVTAASGATSKYTPWIKVQWGEPDLKAKKFSDSKGVERTVWVPDRNMEVHHHTMEALEERGFTTSDPKAIAKQIMASGGSVAMARERQRAQSTKQRDAANAVLDTKRALFLEEVQRDTIDIDIDRPEGTGDYMTLLVKPIPYSIGYEVLGIVDKNATASLNKLAKEQYESLMTQKREREQSARMERRIQQLLKEQEDRLLGGLNAEQRRIVMLKVASQKEAERQTAAAEQTA